MSGPVDHTPRAAHDPCPDSANREVRLAAALVEATDTLTDDFQLDAHVRRLTDRCVELLGVTGAGALLITGTPGTRSADVCLAASSAQQDWVLGLLEVQRYGGPCLDCFRTRAVVPPLHPAVPEVLARWPEFARQAVRHGVITTFAVPLLLRDTVLGALNLFTDAPQPTAEVRLAKALADACAVGLAHQRDVRAYRTLTEQLQSALSSRVLIEQAKGMLAERWHVCVDEAFRALRSHARRNRLPLGQVSRDLLSGALDDAVLPRPKRPPRA